MIKITHNIAINLAKANSSLVIIGSLQSALFIIERLTLRTSTFFFFLFVPANAQNTDVLQNAIKMHNVVPEINY